MLIKFMFLSTFTSIGSYYFENHLCDVMRTHYSTQGHPVALYQCYKMLAFLLATLIIYLKKVARCGKKLASFPGLHTVQFVIICKRSKTGRWEGLGNNFIHKSLLTTPGHFQSQSQYFQSATHSHFYVYDVHTRVRHNFATHNPTPETPCTEYHLFMLHSLQAIWKRLYKCSLGRDHGTL